MIKLKRTIAYGALWLFTALSPPLQAAQSNTPKPDPDTRDYANNYLVKALDLPDISYIVIDYISHEDQYFISLLDLMIRLAYHAYAAQMIGKAEKETLLRRSARNGHLGCVRYLCEQGADIHAKNTWRQTALIQSAKNGHLACTKYLHEQGADIHAKDKTGSTALIWSAYKGHLACVRYLVEQGADINAKDKWEETALIWSGYKGHVDCAHYLRQQGAI